MAEIKILETYQATTDAARNAYRATLGGVAYDATLEINHMAAVTRAWIHRRPGDTYLRVQ